MKYTDSTNLFLKQRLFSHKNTSSNVFIVIEGPSGTGKTTATKLLAKRLRAIDLHSPPKELLPIRQFIDNSDLEVQFLYYLTGNVITSRQVTTQLENTSIVLDRYVFTTAAWFSSLEVNVQVDFLSLNLLQPDFLFLLVTKDEKVRRDRVRAEDRSFTASDSMLETIPGIQQRCLSLFRSFHPIEIDTTDKTVEEIVTLIETILRE